MRVWRDHDVAAGVRIKVEQDEIVIRLVNDEIAAIVARLRLVAEDTGFLAGCGADVAIPPGAPEPVHQKDGGGSGGAPGAPVLSDEPSGPFTRSFNSLLGLKYGI